MTRDDPGELTNAKVVRESWDRGQDLVSHNELRVHYDNAIRYLLAQRREVDRQIRNLRWTVIFLLIAIVGLMLPLAF